MEKDVIIACDFSSKGQVLGFLDRFTETKPFVKIGIELFYAEGPSIVREIKARGHKIFLDLKLHDIPNTVKKAISRCNGCPYSSACATARSMEMTISPSIFAPLSGFTSYKPFSPKGKESTSVGLSRLRCLAFNS